MSIALVPGSFDPITVGHLSVIRRAAAQYDEVVVAVMINDAKTYRYSIEERAEMVRLAVADIPHVRVLWDTGRLVDLFDRVGADVIVKGVRNNKDRSYEEEMASYNRTCNPRAVTVLLDAEEELADVSSTLARELLEGGKSPAAILPPAVLEYLKREKTGCENGSK